MSLVRRRAASDTKYDLHNTRNESWFDESAEISLHEWKTSLDIDAIDCPKGSTPRQFRLVSDSAMCQFPASASQTTPSKMPQN
ncbi:hypothetical protein GCM10011400_16920 [Paraburkholderia caffeinilytica]|uniref:Uncharacterized protein n=1 Tax=Paraburkholderia caffeinilytica TaxID=1761016 RepID=A0ABQ1LXH0_9BURK|nr:hypothetical protein GCM10011400_16920 [Paraburkholderia caffeinilytica]